MVLIDVAPETIAAKKSVLPIHPERRMEGSGRMDWFLPSTSRTNEII